MEYELGAIISVKDLKINDLFWMKYGYGMIKFRVRFVFNNTGVYAHCLSWLKDSCIIIPFNSPNECYYAGKISALRGWFLW